MAGFSRMNGIVRRTMRGATCSSNRSASCWRPAAEKERRPSRWPPTKRMNRSPSVSSLVRTSSWRKRSRADSRMGSTAWRNVRKAAPPYPRSMRASGPRSTRMAPRHPSVRSRSPISSMTSRKVGIAIGIIVGEVGARGKPHHEKILASSRTAAPTSSSDTPSPGETRRRRPTQVRSRQGDA